MAKKLIANVSYDGVMYGPDYPDNKPSAEVLKGIDNADVFEETPDLLEGQEDPSSYAGVSASVLKAEIKRRNEGRDDADKIQASGSADDLAAALMADDEPRTP